MIFVRPRFLIVYFTYFRSALLPLAVVVASELTLGATAYGGRGPVGRAVTQTPRRVVARQPSSKQSKANK